MYDMINEYGDVVLNFPDTYTQKQVLDRLSYVRGKDWHWRG